VAVTGVSGAAQATAPQVLAALPAIRKMAQSPEVVAAVRAQNAKRLDDAALHALDKKWMATTGVADFMKRYLDSPCAKRLAAFKEKELPSLAEAFAMDAQGGLVCSVRKTSDYWQGDEAKWKKAFLEGKGAEFIDKVQFDESSQAYTVQVSVPVRDGKKVIGTLTVGVNLQQ
jgi:hypothetical protein